MTAETEHRSYQSLPPGRLLLLPAVSLVAWAAHLVIVYGLQSLSCNRGLLRGSVLGFDALSFVLLALTLLAAAIIIFAGWRSYRIYQALAPDQPPASRWASDRSAFIAISGAILAALFLLPMLYTLIAIASLQPCALYMW